MRELNIQVTDITRVEGHGNIVLNTKNGNIEKLRLEITESPRFFEPMLLGRDWDEAVHITCRICGICSVGHTTASLRGMEAAMGVKPSEQTVLLRKIALNGEFIQSHVLHVCFLAVPDFLGTPSVLPLINTHEDLVLRALRMKRLANDICAVIGGRHVHPVALRVGGLSKIPIMKDLLALRPRLEEMREDVASVLAALKTVEIPDFERETEYVALQKPGEYALYDGDIASTRGRIFPRERYRDFVLERVVPHSHAKHVRSPDSEYAVGALARFNLNHTWLHPNAQAAAEEMGLKAPCYNPFMNNVAQMVEVAHCVEDTLALMGEIEKRGLTAEERAVHVRAGKGVGAVEVPRGILFHEYEVDHRGTITGANLIIPTGQNQANIEADMHALVPTIMEEPPEEITLKLEMLVRAYDPCISCATHLLEVEFV